MLDNTSTLGLPISLSTSVCLSRSFTLTLSSALFLFLSPPSAHPSLSAFSVSLPPGVQKASSQLIVDETRASVATPRYSIRGGGGGGGGSGGGAGAGCTFRAHLDAVLRRCSSPRRVVLRSPEILASLRDVVIARLVCGQIHDADTPGSFIFLTMSSRRRGSCNFRGRR